jgi:hypothetical protein
MKPRAKEITPAQFMEWVEKNKHRTWHREDHEGNMLHNLPPRTHEIKYLRFSLTFNLDTRDMMIFSISSEGMNDDLSADCREEFDGTILDLLEHKLELCKQKREELYAKEKKRGHR